PKKRQLLREQGSQGPGFSYFSSSTYFDELTGLKRAEYPQQRRNVPATSQQADLILYGSILSQCEVNPCVAGTRFLDQVLGKHRSLKYRQVREVRRFSYQQTRIQEQC